METGDGPLSVAGFDSLAPGAVWKGLVPLRGFAYSKSTRVTAVDLIIDNIAFGRAAYGLANAALCQGDAAGSPNCPGVSWILPLDTATGSPSLTNGEHSVQLRITEDSGRISFQPETPIKVTVDNPATKPPTGVVTAPTNLERVSGTINISGHAWDPDGRITTVVLVVDGATRATLRYGVARPEACATLKDVPACPNIGFEGTLDTRALPNGAHTLAVLLLDNGGLSTQIPSITSSGMNLIVANE